MHCVWYDHFKRKRGPVKEINALDLRRKFGEIMDEVRYRKEPFIVKKNGRAIIVLIDIEAYRATQEHLHDEAFIEEYTDERIKEFSNEDKLDPAADRAARKKLGK